MSEQTVEVVEQKAKRTRSMGHLSVWRLDEQDGGTRNPQASWHLVSGSAKFADTRAALKWVDELAGDGEYMIAREVTRVSVKTETVTTRKVAEVKP